MYDIWWAYLLMQYLPERGLVRLSCADGQVCHALLLSMYSLLNWWDFHLFLWFAFHTITPCCTDYAVFVLRTCISSLVFYVNIPCKINRKEYFTNPIARINVGNVQWIVKRQYYCMPCSILNVSTVCRNVNNKHFILGWITFNRFVLIKSVRCPRHRLAY